MKEATRERGYRPTESKLKGGAKTMYLTYDLEQRTRGGKSAPGQTHDHKNQRVTVKVSHHVYLVSNLSY
jgi:hypothetical protein